jgi:hypothetical protein
MKRRWFIALAIVLALASCGSVAAGPKRPVWGDPDIIEGMKARGTPTPVKVVETPGICIFGEINVNYSRMQQQERWTQPQAKEQRPATDRSARPQK